MGSSKTKKYDRNRWRKIYPRFRALPRWGFRSDKEVVLETLKVKFNDQDAITFQLNGRYHFLPGVVVTPLGPPDPEGGDVNIFITGITIASVPSAGGKTVTVSLGASVKYNGEVYVQVMQI